jgi:ribonuclease J
MGLLRIADASLVDIEDIGELDPGSVCVISTGSQGEPMSALALMASGGNRWLTIGADDTVILSSHPIPGNEMNVSKVIDGLVRLGAEVVHSGVNDVHATGHAKQEELKTVLSITQPEWFIPVHGEYRHLVSHARLARAMGVAADHVLVCEDGDVVELTDDGIRRAERAPAGYLYVDGIVGDVGHGVLRDRRVLAEEGVVVVVVGIDVATGAVITGPEVITRGWVYAPEAEALLDEAREVVAQEVKEAFAGDGPHDVETIQKVVRRSAGRFVNERTRRRPMIVPVVMEA